jgi:hypothetical protein
VQNIRFTMSEVKEVLVKCKCYGCHPELAPKDYTGAECSACLVPVGNGHPYAPLGGDTICVKCCEKMDELHKGSEKLDPVTRDPLLVCPDCNVIVHRFNFAFHYGHCIGKTQNMMGTMRAHADNIKKRNALTKSKQVSPNSKLIDKTKKRVKSKAKAKPRSKPRTRSETKKMEKNRQ